MLDDGLVTLFAQQTQSLRLLDRRLGAGRLLSQTESHVQQMSDVLTYARGGQQRAALAGAAAEAASLAGWQALDLGRPDRAWALYETAKAAARESGQRAVLAHVTAEQAYTLIDLGRVRDGVEQIRYARHEAGQHVPSVLRAWLWAAEAEALAAAGEESRSRAALDGATSQGLGTGESELGYLVLDENHLARWRGHCLARLGAAEAVEDLSGALGKLDSSFARARAGLLCDLALAHSVRGEKDAAQEHARQASTLAEATTSKRQQKRIRQLLGGGVV
jgi:tetratricopeptide (TPR) repeat protein